MQATDTHQADVPVVDHQKDRFEMQRLSYIQDIVRLEKRIEALLVEQKEIAEKAFREGFETHMKHYSTDAAWEASDIRKEMEGIE